MELNRLLLRVVVVVMLVIVSDLQVCLGDGSTSTIRRGGAELTSRASRKLLDFPHGGFVDVVGGSVVHSDPRPPFINPGPLLPSPPSPSTYLRSKEAELAPAEYFMRDYSNVSPPPPAVIPGPLFPSPPPPPPSDYLSATKKKLGSVEYSIRDDSLSSPIFFPDYNPSSANKPIDDHNSPPPALVV